MSDYENKQEERRERYQDRARKARLDAQDSFERSRRETAGIPFGQPILVGHHSERGHRAALKRSDNAMRKGVEASDKAEHYDHKAAGVGKAGISSDDPEALVKLRAKLEGMQAAHDRMKAINKAWRLAKKPKADDSQGWMRVELALKTTSLDFSSDDIIRIRQDQARDFIERAPYTYQLQNNSGNMKRVRERIAELEVAPEEPKTTAHHGFLVHENPDANRIQLIFPHKPAEEVRTILKRQGFRWSPTEQAWQRHLNNAGRHAAGEVVEAMVKLEAK
ncbi:MAG: DUF3560 domain-containing protein [Nannocystaceae bacterium]